MESLAKRGKQFNLLGVIFHIACLFLMLVPPTEGSAKVLLDLRDFENPGSLQYDGTCCDGEIINQTCTSLCDYSISICLGNATSSPCALSRLNLGYLESRGTSFTFPDTFHDGYSNPVPVEMDKWEGSVQITVYVYDQDTAAKQLVDIFSFPFSMAIPIKERLAVPSDYTDFQLVGSRDRQKSRLRVSVTARCDRFFYTDSCDVNCVPSDDCRGHYTCDVTDGSKICFDGWAGERCNISLSEDLGCPNEYCLNRGVCVPYGNRTNQAYCCCNDGYTGDVCEQDVDECASEPCLNGGQCLQGAPPLFSCVCPPGWKGSLCEESETCEDNPCENGGFCRTISSQRLRQGSFFVCDCDESFTGEFCEIPVTTQEATTTTAITKTTTAPVPAHLCYGNYYGPLCETHCYAMDDCSGHYLCDAMTGQKLCLPGWTQESNCTQRTLPDSECQCQNEGECFAGGCCCPLGYTGPLCTQPSSACLTNPCSNGGTCTVNFLTGAEECVCPESFDGRRCELMVTPNRNCQNGYYGPSCETYCVPQYQCGSSQYYCDEITGERLCMFGWVGELCDTPDLTAQHREPCPSSVCRNGFCVGETCCCAPGYTGTLCQTKILACERRPCLNGGRCVDGINSYYCECPSEYVGLNCEIKVSAEDNAPATNTRCATVFCRNGGTCIPNGVSSFYCLCAERYIGLFCETLLPSQANNLECQDFYYGPDCNVRCEERDSCAEGHFYCNPITGNKVCRSGWGGNDCSTRLISPEVDPSCPKVGSSCQNGASCFAGFCCCPKSYDGYLCQNEIIPCNRPLPDQENTCGDNGICVDREGINYTCRCINGFSGPRCKIDPTDMGVPGKITSIVLVSDATAINVIGTSDLLLLPTTITIEPTFTTISEVTTSEPTYPPVECGNFSCYNGGTCYFTSLGMICRCPRENMGSFCEILDNAFIDSSLPAVTRLPASQISIVASASILDPLPVLELSASILDVTPSASGTEMLPVMQTSVEISSSEKGQLASTALLTSIQPMFQETSSQPSNARSSEELVLDPNILTSSSSSQAILMESSQASLHPQDSLSSIIINSQYFFISPSSSLAASSITFAEFESSGFQPTAASTIIRGDMQTDTLYPSPDVSSAGRAIIAATPETSVNVASSNGINTETLGVSVPLIVSTSAMPLGGNTVYTVTSEFSASSAIPISMESIRPSSSFIESGVSPTVQMSNVADGNTSGDTARTKPPAQRVLHQGILFITGSIQDSDISTLVDKTRDALLQTISDFDCCLNVVVDRDSLYFNEQGCVSYLNDPMQQAVARSRKHLWRQWYLRGS